MDEISLKETAPEEAAEIAGMARRIWPDAYRGIISEEQIDYMLGWMYAPEEIAREITEEGVRYFWIGSSGENVGFLSVGPVRPRERAYLYKCYLLCENHGRGIGSRALGALVDFLAEAGISELELRVNRHNSTAISFYEKNGFLTVAEDRADIGGGFAMDDFIMRRAV